MSQKGLKTIALLEASKGLLAIIVSFGLHALAGENIQQAAERLVMHLHLNPASHYPSVMLHALEDLNSANVTWLALGALAYSLIRFVEAYGLWHKLRWTEWFALLSGAIYVPFEVYELFHTLNLLSAIALVVNLMVVFYLYFILKSQRHALATK